jgi:hypothetical protein
MITTRNDDQLPCWLKDTSRIDGVLIALGGAVVLLGWMIGSDMLKRLLPGLVAMNPITAVGFMMAGLSLFCFWLQQDKALAVAAAGRALGGILAFLGTLKLCQYLVGWGIPFDQMLFRGQLRGDPTGFSNQISPNTALNFVLGGLSLWFLNSSRGRFSRPAQNLAMTLVFTSLAPLVGCLYQAAYLYSVGSYIPMALHTAGLFCLLAIGILFAQSDAGVIGILTRPNAGRLARAV